MKKIGNEMIKDDISLNDVTTKSLFMSDQRLLVEKMAKLLDNQFEPVFEEPDTSYDCRLLKDLSKDDGTPSSTIEGLLTMDDLKSRLEKQIEMEIDGQVVVKNIAKSKLSKESVDYWVRFIESMTI